MIPFSKLSQSNFIRIYENIYSQPFRIVQSTFKEISEKRYQDIQALSSKEKRAAYLKIIQAKLRKEQPIRKIYSEERLLEMTLQSALRLCSESDLDFEQFHEFFPLHSASFKEAQYQKCLACHDIMTCTKENKCLDLEELSPCQQAVNSIMKMNDIYKKQVEAYQTSYDKWLAEK